MQNTVSRGILPVLRVTILCTRCWCAGIWLGVVRNNAYGARRSLVELTRRGSTHGAGSRLVRLASSVATRCSAIWNFLSVVFSPSASAGVSRSALSSVVALSKTLHSNSFRDVSQSGDLVCCRPGQSSARNISGTREVMVGAVFHCAAEELEAPVLVGFN